ncbi:MAG TPA: hypothetical protein VFO69_10040 [Allosphingosinicella sp.]|nr:hypothetical protein [Allosphingosinicella sp.]
MRRVVKAAVHAVFVLPAVMALASCGGADETNKAESSETDSNVMFERIGNDASALEAAANASPLAPSNDVAADGEAADEDAPTNSGADASQSVLGETEGGDTGGNTIQGNVSGT